MSFFGGWNYILPLVQNMVTLSSDQKASKDYKFVTLLDHYKNYRKKDFSIDFRPSLKKMPNGEWGPNPSRLWPEDLWTGIKKGLAKEVW